MKRSPFNDGWQFREKVNPFAELGGEVAPYTDIVVPHDAQIARERDPNGDGAVAYFPDGAYQYRKLFNVPAELAGSRIVLEFEGVYRDAMVYINGAFAGQRPYGYSGFTIDADQFLLPGEENLLEVEARSGKDSRWYTGAGIYRDVWLLTGSDVHIPTNGLRVSTPDIDAEGAIVEVEIVVENTRNRPVTVDLEALLANPAGAEIANGTARVTIAAHTTSVSRQRLYVADPALWSAESPALYTADVNVRFEDDPIDHSATKFGIRRLQVDPVHGLRINGETVKLRGACIHHDNGILGAATFAAAEERRVRLLKEAGFNAIRSAHNPLSASMIEACDRLGMYVMDETFDMWTSGKMPNDYSLHFAEWWERDVEAMIAKDFNHPSVIMYSIGNEIPETGSPEGGLTGRALAEKVRELDPTRFVTNAVNGMLAVMDDIKKLAAERGAGADEGAGINTLMSGPGEFMNMIGASPMVTEKTAESFGVLDIAGMNYLDARYEIDKELFPNRVIVGTETFPTHIDVNWQLVRENSHIIGDFTWTGFDYLGEVGIGRPQYLLEGEAPTHGGPFPWIAAWCGDIDLIGNRRPASYYREILFGLRTAPYIAIQRPRPDGTSFYAGPWTWSDSIGSWTWSGNEGRTLTAEVYSDADEVELSLNSTSLGVAAAGPRNRFRAEFQVPYEAGELIATAIRGGERAEVYSLRTATGVPVLKIEVDPGVPDDRLVFIDISLADSEGRVFTDRDKALTVQVSGDGELLAFGGADPAPSSNYAGAAHATFDGRALAVVRRTGSGPVDFLVSADGVAPVETTVAGLHYVEAL
ncbi:glycoside hydrolase family 2 TIM barrel-domain containing protein [Leifsonia poae]|uniref:Beta-galactosidase n=1 Tax=Leifsonia poae TaxID=110933 RepID=A0A9W6LZT0_9MICO|nr:glycoside hydrolase family 2 TIM barrel-domain containing protein [Leifsonia poae]GLJ76215.1 beta-galactosidase [Leifsonia poae]